MLSLTERVMDAIGDTATVNGTTLESAIGALAIQVSEKAKMPVPAIVTIITGFLVNGDMAVINHHETKWTFRF